MTLPLLVGASGRDPAFADVASADLELVGLDGRVLLVGYRLAAADIPSSELLVTTSAERE
jgi:hypothetical protein